MISDFKNLIINLMKTKNLNVFFIDNMEMDISNYDGGLRKQIFNNFEFNNVKHWINNVDYNILYHMQDTFYLHYDLCKILYEGSDECVIFMIGPYLLESDPVDLTHIIQMNNLPLYSHSELESFYRTVTLLPDPNNLEQEILVLLKFFHPNLDFSIDTQNTVDNYLEILNTEVSYNYDKPFSISSIEKLYNNEDALLNAISQGNYTQALNAMNELSSYSPPKSFRTESQKLKHFLIVHNSLFRKEVQRSNVHPAYIDKISTSFIIRIEKSVTIQDLTKIYHDMLRKYCMLVQNHSLSGYSSIIQNALNYIEFHILEDLTLKHIALKVKSSPNYLSSQFKREVGKTLTEYVNEKRIEKSLLLLTTTDLQIQEIAEKVGINDVNYFSRLFRKIYGMSARDYRKQVQETKS